LLVLGVTRTAGRYSRIQNYSGRSKSSKGRVFKAISIPRYTLGGPRSSKHSIDPGSTHLSLGEHADVLHFGEAVTSRGRYLASSDASSTSTFEIPARSYELLKNVPPFRVNPFHPSIHLTRHAPRARISL